MNKNLHKTFSIVVSIIVISLSLFVSLPKKNRNIEMVDITEIADIADKTIRPSNYTTTSGSEITIYNGIQTFKKQLSEQNISDLDTAKFIYRYIGEPDQAISTRSEIQLLEALKFKSIKKSTDYVAYVDDEQRQLTKQELLQALAQEPEKLTDAGREILLENNVDTSNGGSSTPPGFATPMDSTSITSNDGYMALTTISSETTGPVAGRKYYEISSLARWLKAPRQFKKDVLAITSNATYDNSYDDYGYFLEEVDDYVGDSYKGTGRTFYNISKFAGASSSNIEFEYSAGISGLAIRFDLYAPGYYTDTAHQYIYKKFDAYLRYRISIYNTDGGVQMGYGHKKWGLNEISINLSPPQIKFSIIGSMDKYFGRPLSLYF